MGHWNTQFSNHLPNSEANEQSNGRRQSEPSIFYGNVPNSFHHHPNTLSLIPPARNFNFHHMPEHSENVFFHNIAQYQGVPTQHPPAYLDLAVAQPSNQYNPYSVSGDSLPFQANHGASGRLHLPSAHYGTVNLPQVTPLMDNDPLKRKNVEMASAIFPRHNSMDEAGSQNAASFAPNEYMGNIQSLFIEGESSRSVRNRPDVIGRDANVPYGAGTVVLGSSNGLGPSPVPLYRNPWSDMTSFGSCNGDIGTYLWQPAPNFPYMHAANGARVEAGNLGVQSYQLAPSNRNSHGFMRPAPPFVQHPPFLHVQSAMGYGINYPLQVGPSSQIFPNGSSSNSAVNRYQNVLEAGSMSVTPIQSPGARQFGPHIRQQPVLGANERRQNSRGLRFFRSDETAILDITGTEAASSVDQHNAMRMDIEDMSYEELLALEEEIGFVATGLSEEFIQNNLKSRNYTLSEVGIDLEDTPLPDQQTNLCAVCQDEYGIGDVLASLDCGHEYHKGCIKQWLVLRNTCPICKAEALSNKEQ